MSLAPTFMAKKATSKTGDIPALLDRVRKNFPKLKKKVEAMLREAGLEVMLEQKIQPATPVKNLPTFDKKKSRPLSPMLKARFAYASTWQEGADTWLNPQQMAKFMASRAVQATHRSLREHWQDSAPMLYLDSQLTLFGITEDVPENLTYLVWLDGAEPEVWVYAGMNMTKHKDLAEFLKRRLK